MLALVGTTNFQGEVQNLRQPEKTGSKNIYIFILLTAHQLPEAKTDVWNAGQHFDPKFEQRNSLDAAMARRPTNVGIRAMAAL